MSLNCMGCGEFLLSRGVLRGSPRSEGRLGLPEGVETDHGRLFVRCQRCDGKNFLIKEYALGGVFLRLSHYVSDERPQSRWSPPLHTYGRELAVPYNF